ncbi:MAG TPA: DUF262 domain-containing protein [Chthoniobacterales bacterium]
MDRLTIRQIVEAVESGQVRIPAFQRGFVWEPDRVAFFMDTLFKHYPFGSLLIWRTNEKLKVERNLGPIELPPPKADFPIDYVLDGQQRITSAFLTFQTNREIIESAEWKDIFFDHTIADAAQENQFLALSKDEIDSSRHFPLRAFFDTVNYRRLTKNLKDELAQRLDAVQARFKEVSLPVQIFKTEDKGTVAVIFERINRQGVPLNTMQLLSAWTWSEEFQLQGQFDELTEELDEFGYSSGQIDENLLLRCTAAILIGSARPESIVEIPGERVRKRFDEVINGIKGALDFLRTNLSVQRIDNLPFQTLLVPLSVFFAVSGTKEIVVSANQRAKMLRWFWRASFSKRYSSGVIRNLEDDIKAMLQLRGGQESNLGEFPSSVDCSFFVGNRFSLGSVNTKTMILLLAQQQPLSFVSGAPIDLENKLKEYNKAEFHHLMPRSFLKDFSKPHLVDALVNFAFISKSENKTLGGVAPSEYRKKMPENVDDILEHALCPPLLFKDDFNDLIRERSLILASAAAKLIDN